MQVDEIIWKTINHQFCSYKVKTETSTFCRNEFNVSGLCNRQSCPLANSRYATVRNDNGILYLYSKTIERAHSPIKLWERIKLSKNYAAALEQIDTALIHWPPYLQHKCKQRLTKLTQHLIRTRRLALKTSAPILEGVKKKLDRRERTRERKAEIAARLEQSIEKELLERLRRGVYDRDTAGADGIVNLDQDRFDRALDMIEDEMDAAGAHDMELQDDDDGDVDGGDDWEGDEFDMEEWGGDDDDGDDEEDDGVGTHEFVSDISDSEHEDDVGDIEDFASKPVPKSGKRNAVSHHPASRKTDKKKKRVTVEYEEEHELDMQRATH